MRNVEFGMRNITRDSYSLPISPRFHYIAHSEFHIPRYGIAGVSVQIPVYLKFLKTSARTSLRGVLAAIPSRVCWATPWQISHDVLWSVKSMVPSEFMLLT